ncbi:MAG: PLDc N-terminal domain-containing protein [Bacteroidales bacterium]|nr:PLDc N-terminal domain-containing protein [Bacteroidales bacterium]
MSILLSILFGLLLAGVMLVILTDNVDSSKKISWMLIIAVLPIIGIILYLCLGVNYRHHWYFYRKHRHYRDVFTEGTTHEINRLLFSDKSIKGIEERFRPLARLLSQRNFPTPSQDNSVEIITCGKRKFELLMKDITDAKEYIHMEYYLFGNDKWSNRVKEALMEKARQGVKVRFVHENVANFSIRERYYNEMRKAGIEVVKFTNPRKHFLKFVTTLNFRDHRKIVVIDGKIGYTGGMNIKDRYFELWRDTHMRVEGPAVASLQYIFMDAWLSADGQIDLPFKEYFQPWATDLSAATPPAGIPQDVSFKVDSLDSPLPVLSGKTVQMVPDEPDVEWPITQMGYEWILHNAKEYVYIQTPYFIPPEPLLNAIKSAALSGVDVRLMLPQRVDTWFIRPANKSYYTEVLEAGVKIYLRGGQFIHSKTLVCDDYLSIVGSSNLDPRSFDINYEINSFIYDKETATLCKEVFLKDLELCEELDLEQWEKRSWTSVLYEKVMRLFAPMI